MENEVKEILDKAFLKLLEETKNMSAGETFDYMDKKFGWGKYNKNNSPNIVINTGIEGLEFFNKLLYGK